MKYKLMHCYFLLSCRLCKQYEALANEDKHQNDFVEQLILQK